VIAIVGAVSLACYAYYYFDNFHYHVTSGYAHLGYPEAQHVVGQKLLYGERLLHKSKVKLGYIIVRSKA